MNNGYISMRNQTSYKTYQGSQDERYYIPDADFREISSVPAKKKTSVFRKMIKAAGMFLIMAAIAIGGGIAGSHYAINSLATTVTDVKDAAMTNTEMHAISVSSGEMLSSVEAAAQISPCVVSITTEQMQVNQFWFGPQIVSGAGSGVILSEDGYILTCAHVVSGASTISVTTNDGIIYPARIIGSYEDGDIAVIKIDADNLTPVQPGNSESVVLGEPVYAVGNPGGDLNGTVTEGIISSVNRTISISLDQVAAAPFGGAYPQQREVTINVLQTSAAVSPGNSGGGLFNAYGELIGIVNAKSSGTGQEGLGFAIPVNTALEIAQSLIENGQYVPSFISENTNRAILDIMVTEVDQSMAAAYRMDTGVYVQSVTDGGASSGKLERGDRLIALNGNTIKSLEDLSKQLSVYEPGDAVSVSVERENRMMSFDIILAQNKQIDGI